MDKISEAQLAANRANAARFDGAERKATEGARLAKAVRLHRLSKIMELPYEPEDDGFDCSSEDLEDGIDRQVGDVASVVAMKWDFDRAKFRGGAEEIAGPGGGASQQRPAG